MQKRFIIRKFIMATSISQALQLDKTTKPDECWIDPEWTRMQDEAFKSKLMNPVGYDEKRSKT